MSAHASIVSNVVTFSSGSVEKSNNIKHVYVHGAVGLVGNMPGTFALDTSSNTVSYNVTLDTGWKVSLNLVTSSDFGMNVPRCGNGNTCEEMSQWLHLSLDASRESTFSKDDWRYLITGNSWGQFGQEAGGTLVTAIEDAYAFGFWTKSWKKQQSDNEHSQWKTKEYGYGGDINGNLTVVPVPVAAWLFGSAVLALVGFRRHRQS